MYSNLYRIYKYLVKESKDDLFDNVYIYFLHMLKEMDIYILSYLPITYKPL